MLNEAKTGCKNGTQHGVADGLRGVRSAPRTDRTSTFRLDASSTRVRAEGTKVRETVDSRTLTHLCRTNSGDSTTHEINPNSISGTSAS